MSGPTQAYSIRGEGTETLEIDIYDVIGESFWSDSVSAKSVRAALKGAKNAKTIKVRVNSAGGDVFDGFAIYGLLAEHGAHVIAEIDALAASMASVVVMAADEIRIAAHGMMMIHNPWTFAMGESSDLRGAADLLDKLRGQIADAYVARTGVERDRVLEMMDAETWMTADEAKEDGFVDAVKPSKRGAEKEKALASLDLRALERTPAVFAMAVAGARKRATRRAARAQETNAMSDEELSEIRTLLGLEENASGADILQAIRDLKAAEPDEEEEDEEEDEEETKALRSQLEQKDAAYREAIAQRDEARTQLATYADAEIKALVDGAIARTPGLGPKRAALEKSARADRGTFEELYGAAAPTPILVTITRPTTGARRGGSGELTDREQAFFRSFKASRLRVDGKLASEEQLRALAREKAAETAR